jgi:hypothetical protein
MDYKIRIQITNHRGDELLDKSIKLLSLDTILDLNLPDIYAEAQQNELTDLDSVPQYDDTENYRESLEL